MGSKLCRNIASDGATQWHLPGCEADLVVGWKLNLISYQSIAKLLTQLICIENNNANTLWKMLVPKNFSSTYGGILVSLVLVRQTE